MRKMNLAVLGTAALALALGAGAVGAQMPGPEGPGGTGPRMGRAEGMARFLGLSEAQKVEVQNSWRGGARSTRRCASRSRRTRRS